MEGKIDPIGSNERPKTRTIVPIGQMKTGSSSNEILLAPHLGSCLGVSVYDRDLRYGCLVHLLLPTSTIDPEKGKREPYIYVDSGLKKLFEMMLKRGSKLKSLDIAVAGGAAISDPNDPFEIGRKNFIVLRKMLWENNLLIKKQKVGGRVPRTIELNVGNGTVNIIEGKALVSG